MAKGPGPLLPGVEEFDVPRRPWPRWVAVLLVLVVGTALAVPALGFVAGVGPMRSLALETTELPPLAYRPTTNERVVQVSVGVPAAGICPDAVVEPSAEESASGVRVRIALTQDRNADCGTSGAGTQRQWVDIELAGPLAGRSVARASDGTVLPRETDLG